MNLDIRRLDTPTLEQKLYYASQARKWSTASLLIGGASILATVGCGVRNAYDGEYDSAMCFGGIVVVQSFFFVKRTMQKYKEFKELESNIMEELKRRKQN